MQVTRHHRRRHEGRSNPPHSPKPTDDVTMLPMIVVRDILGRELDTNSVQQRLINAARWRVANGCGVRHPGEWRLPHVPVPARPDYSRTVHAHMHARPPALTHAHTHAETHARTHTYPRTHIRTHIRTQTHTHTRIHTRTRTRTHTHATSFIGRIAILN